MYLTSVPSSTLCQRLATPSSSGFVFSSGKSCNRSSTRHLQVVRAEPERTPDGKTVKKVSDPMSPEFKARLRDEYIGLGGSANKPMAQNYFLWIILIIGFLAILSYITGAI